LNFLIYLLCKLNSTSSISIGQGISERIYAIDDTNWVIIALNMSAKNFKDPRREGEDRRTRGGDRRDDPGPRREESIATKNAVSRSVPTAATDRRTEGAARPDRFAQGKARISRRHIWGPTALIVIVVSMATAELSGGYVSGFIAEQLSDSNAEQLSDSNYETTRNDGGSSPSLKAPAPRIKSSGGTSGPAPGTSLAKAMAIKEPTIKDLKRVDTSSCPPMPKVAIWGNLTHTRVINYVDRRHDGDWTVYLDKWDKQAGKIKEIYDRGSAIRIGKNKIKIEGKQLAEYAAQVRQRANINRCLSKLVGTTDS
jgi:hypothetical protein